jgi:hypothetical protein
LYLLVMTQLNTGPESFIEAEKMAIQAAAAPSLMPIRRGALYLAASCEGYLGSPRRPKPDLEMRRRAVANVRAVIALGPIQPIEYEIMTKAANYADDIDLTRTLLAGWEPIAPKNEAVLQIRYEVEIKAKNPGRAVAAAAEGLKLFPNDAWRQRHKRALDQLQEQLKSVQEAPR